VAASQPVPPSGSSSFLDIWLEPFTNDGQPGSIMSWGGVLGGSGSGGTFVSSFDVSVKVVTDGAGPRSLRLRSEAPVGQPVHFASGSSLQMIDGKLHIIPKLVFDGPVDQALPLFTITMTPEPTSLVLLVLGGLAALRRKRR